MARAMVGNASGLAIHAKTVSTWLPEGEDPLLAEQRTATADGAEREREHAESGGQVVAAHQEQQHAPRR